MRTSTIRRLTSGLMAAAGLMAVPAVGTAQGDTTALTSRSGVYTTEQAAKGKDVHGAACLSCHKAAEFMGEKFWSTLVDRPLLEFFKYIKSDMPQDNPGSLSDDDYVNVIAYIFSLNTMPAGQKPLASDTTTLAKIKVVSPAPSAPIAPTSKGRGK